VGTDFAPGLPRLEVHGLETSKSGNGETLPEIRLIARILTTYLGLCRFTNCPGGAHNIINQLWKNMAQKRSRG
jgi:hypothetical protein